MNRDGLSVPLLSVSIAGLMAIFLDGKLASRVAPQSLSLVVYQGTAALLDKRLSATSTPESSGLDSSTQKKMVKAINKVRICFGFYLSLKSQLQISHLFYSLQFKHHTVQDDMYQ